MDLTETDAKKHISNSALETMFKIRQRIPGMPDIQVLDGPGSIGSRYLHDERKLIINRDALLDFAKREKMPWEKLTFKALGQWMYGRQIMYVMSGKSHDTDLNNCNTDNIKAFAGTYPKTLDISKKS